MFSFSSTEVGCHKSHGSTSSLDVYHLRHVFQGIDDHFCIITIAQIAWLNLTARHGMDDEGTIADAFTGGQVDGGVECLRCFYLVFHLIFLLFLK